MAQLHGVTEVRIVPVIDHKSMGAFRFEKDDNTVTRFEKQVGDATSIAATGVGRSSLKEHTKFTTGGVYTAIVNGEEIENKE